MFEHDYDVLQRVLRLPVRPAALRVGSAFANSTSPSIVAQSGVAMVSAGGFELARHSWAPESSSRPLRWLRSHSFRNEQMCPHRFHTARETPREAEPPIAPADVAEPSHTTTPIGWKVLM